jgi:hypothetical protein
MRFSVRGVGRITQYEWKIDRHAVAGASEASFTLPGTLDAGDHEVEVTSIDGRGMRSSPHHWTVSLHDVAPPPVAAPAGKGQMQAAPDVTEAEARDWVTELRKAYDRHDVGALRGMGVNPGTDEQANRVEIGDASIILDSRGAAVYFDQTDTDRSGTARTHKERFRLTRGPSGLVAAPR